MKFIVLFALLAMIGPSIAGFAQFMQGAMRAFSAAPQAMMHQFEGVTVAEKRAAGQPAAGQPAAQAN